jgi:hypothetical protein
LGWRSRRKNEDFVTAGQMGPFAVLSTTAIDGVRALVVCHLARRILDNDGAVLQYVLVQNSFLESVSRLSIWPALEVRSDPVCWSFQMLIFLLTAVAAAIEPSFN